MGKHLFIKLFQLINEKEMIEYSPTHNKSMDLDTEYQFQLTSQEGTRHSAPSVERIHHDLWSGQKVEPESAQISGSMCQYPEDRRTC